MITITGTGGDLGGRIINHLERLGDPPGFKATSRNMETLKGFAERGFATAIVDFDQPETMADAFKGSEAVLIISGNAPVPARMKQQRAALQAAVDAGVAHVIYTSFANATPDSLFPFAEIHADTEAAIKASGLSYTILRNPMYAENITGALQHATQTGTLALPGSAGRASYLLKEDIAEITARVLVGRLSGEQTYELTGNDSLTLTDIADIATHLWQKPITAAEMPSEVFGALLEGMGMPDFVVTALQGIQLAVGAGEFAQVTPDAARLLGRKPDDLHAFVSRFG